MGDRAHVCAPLLNGYGKGEFCNRLDERCSATGLGLPLGAAPNYDCPSVGSATICRLITGCYE